MLLASPLFSQVDYDYFEIDSNEVYVIELRDRSEYIGEIIAQDSSSFTLRTAAKIEVKIPMDRIKKMKIASSQERINAGIVGVNGVEKSSKYPFPNPTYQNYYYSKTAIPLERGSIYYRNTYVLINSLEVGITNFLSIDAGFETISTLIIQQPIFYITPRFNFRIANNLYVGASYFIGSFPEVDEDARITIGLASALITYGNTNDNITVNFSIPSLYHELEPIPSIRISGRFALVSDNWIVPGERNSLYDDDEPNLYSYGVRFISSTSTLDIAFARSGFRNSGIGIGFPYVSACVKF